MEPYAFFQKQFVPLSEAKVSIMTHALHYGTACFDGIRGNWNEEEDQIYLFRVREHYVRLLNSCRILKMTPPYSVDELCQLTLELVEKNGYHEDIYIRPLAYKSSEALWVRLHNLEDNLAIFTIGWGPYLDSGNGIRCRTSSWRRIDDTMMPTRAKICGVYVNSALARTEAWEDGFDEAIMLTNDGHVAEGSGENIFILTNGKLVTPPSTDNILMGITRDTVIKLAKDELGIDTEERHVDRSELYLADACFLTGTAAHITPVLEVDNYKVGTGSIDQMTKQLQQLYFDVIYGRNAKYRDWCTPAYRKPA